ncbi:hypothetical protein FBUS_11177 [Fasciolopsis buskii]|uniref:Uncharacterized protein n=1 Tax=Fasciolopsis buskii TaxID=27845 RepID=A0A8E0RRA1_9TREM|nr:hypothetical protein FBUS_11177 [Fasciolopsis buski]
MTPCRMLLASKRTSSVLCVHFSLVRPDGPKRSQFLVWVMSEPTLMMFTHFMTFGKTMTQHVIILS